MFSSYRAYEILSSELKREEYDQMIGKNSHAEFFKTGPKDRRDDYSFSFFKNRQAREDFTDEMFVDFKTYFGSEHEHSKI